MKNLINSCSLKEYKEHIEAGILRLQSQIIPVNNYTFSFIINELAKYIAEEEHPRYIPYISGSISDGIMLISIDIADRFNQEKWADNLIYHISDSPAPQKPQQPKQPVVVQKPEYRVVPVPKVELFNSEVQTAVKMTGYKRNMSNTICRKYVKAKFTTYTEYVNFVAALFDEFLGCTDCLNKSLIAAFLGKFAYPEAFISTGKINRQHLKLKPEIEITEDVKKKFQIDWEYFLNNWDNAILLAQYKDKDALRTYKNGHTCLDLVEQFNGDRTYQLTDFGKVIWEKVREIIGLLPEADEAEEEAIESSTPEEPEAPAKEPKKEVPESPVAEEIKVRHMGYNKCNGCAYFDKHKQWCDKRQGYINTLEHDECFEEEKPELEIATQNEVERICYNCKRWHSGNNPGSLKAIACRCPIQGKKTLTDDTCNKFVAIVRKEN